MKLIVDSNIIFSALIKDSLTRHLITHIDAELFTIDFSYQEIMKYKKEIIKKSKMSEFQIDLIFKQVMEKLISIDNLLVKLNMPDAKKIMQDIDQKDAPFIAAALATGFDIWSNDKDFEKQNKIKVYKTEELIQYL